MQGDSDGEGSNGLWLDGCDLGRGVFRVNLGMYEARVGPRWRGPQDHLGSSSPPAPPIHGYRVSNDETPHTLCIDEVPLTDAVCPNRGTYVLLHSIFYLSADMNAFRDQISNYFIRRSIDIIHMCIHDAASHLPHIRHGSRSLCISGEKSQKECTWDLRDSV